MDISKMYCKVTSPFFNDYLDLAEKQFGTERKEALERIARFRECRCVVARAVGWDEAGYMPNDEYYAIYGYTEFCNPNAARKYRERSFDLVSDAIRFLENGNKLYMFTYGVISEVDTETAARYYDTGMLMIKLDEQKTWAEMMDGQTVLCFVSTGNGEMQLAEVVGRSQDKFVTSTGEKFQFATPVSTEKLEKYVESHKSLNL